MLEKILEEIEKEIRNQKTIWKSLKKPPYNDFEQSLWIAGMRNAKDIIRKHINAGKDINVPTKDNDGWIPVEDERLWDILFEEACVEGEQAKRIYNRLKETFGGERSEMDGK